MVTHIERQPVDVDLALRQWQTYVAALETAGWEVIHVPPMDECPDGVFIEDDVVMYGDRAVVARPGADERKPETAAIADLLGALGYDVVSIEAPGTLDGGDVLKVGDTIYVGRGGRTNAEGIRAAPRESWSRWARRSSRSVSARCCTSSRRSPRCPTARSSATRRWSMTQGSSAGSCRCPRSRGVAHQGRPVAARERAVPVAEDQGGPEGGGDQAFGAADIQRLTLAAEDGGDDLGVTRQPPDGGDGELVDGVVARPVRSVSRGWW